MSDYVLWTRNAHEVCPCTLYTLSVATTDWMIYWGLQIGTHSVFLFSAACRKDGHFASLHFVYTVSRYNQLKELMRFSDWYTQRPSACWKNDHIASLQFVHTASCYYRLKDLMRFSDWHPQRPSASWSVPERWPYCILVLCTHYQSLL